MNRRRGFTLVELVVVVFIILVLASLLFPVFARARAKAHATSAKANLAQLDSFYTLEGLQTLKDGYLGSEFLLEHGAVKTSGPDADLSYYHYIPTAYGRQVLITLDADGYTVDIEPEEKPNGLSQLSEQGFHSLVAESWLRAVDITLVHPRLGLVRVTKDKEGLKMNRLAPPKAEAEPSKR